MRCPVAPRGAANRLSVMSARPDWLTDSFPELRSGPPWVMEEMIDSEPELLERIATGLDTSAVALMLRASSPVTVTGCGTSEHASMAVAGILRDAGHAATSAEAFELLLDPPSEGCVIGVSHEAGT